MDEDTFTRSKQEGVHRWLQSLSGEWQGVVRTWFTPGELGDESVIRGVIWPVVGGRFLIHEYETTLAGEPCQGLALYGYHVENEEFQSAWVDNCHNGTRIMFSEGRGNSFNVLGHYPAPEGPDWGWRTEIDVLEGQQLLITAYNVSPAGEEARAIEIDYRRKE